MKKLYTLLIALMLFFTLDVFSQNLLPDPDFSVNPTNYVFQTGTAGSGVLDLTVDHTGNGSYSYELTATTGTNNLVKYTLDNTSGYPISAGELTFSFWIKGTAGNRVNCNLYNGGTSIWPNGETGIWAEHYVIQETDTWEQVTKTITATTAGYAQVRIYNKVAGTTIHIDDIFLGTEVVPAVERLDYTFNDVNDAEGFVGANGVTLSQPTPGTITLSIDDTQLYPNLEQASGLYTVNADIYKQVEVTLINDSPKNQLTFVSPEGGNQFKTSGMVTDAVNPQTVSIDISASDNWTGTQTNWFFQFKDNDGTLVASAGTIHIQQIKFVSNNVWTGAIDSDWSNAANWSAGVVATANFNVVIPTATSIVISGDASCNSLQVSPGGRFTVGATLTAGGSVTVQSDASNNGSIVFTGSGNITASTTTKSTQEDATITYERYVTGGKWHMLSAPVAGQDIATLLSATADNIVMKDYDVAGDQWNDPLTTGTMSAGTGYTTKKDSDGIISISGTQNGTVSVALTGTGNGWNLLGNPYTSAIATSSDAGATDYLLNSGNLEQLNPIYGALYIWNEDDTYDGTQNYYKLINNAGDASLGNVDHLQVGQGFFVQAIASPGNFGFNINMQDDVPAATFYKDASASSWPTIELNAETSSSRATTVLTYDSQMTRGLDVSYDAGLLNSYPDFALYTHLLEGYENVDFMLQALPTDYENLVVPVGLDAKAGEIVTFSAKTVDLPEAYAVVLEDKAKDIFTDLSDGSEYSIQLIEDSEGTGRFFVHTSFKSALGLDDFSAQDFMVFPQANENRITIKGEVNEGAQVKIFNITGKLVANYQLNNLIENDIYFAEDSGIYILQLNDHKGSYAMKFAWVK